MSGSKRKLVKGSCGILAALLLGLVPASILGVGGPRTDVGASVDTFVSTVVNGKTREARSWTHLTLPSPDTDEDASISFTFTTLDTDETKGVFTVVLPSELYDDHVYDCEGQDKVDPAHYSEDELPTLHRENIKRHREKSGPSNRSSSNEGLANEPSRSRSSETFRLIVASADANRRTEVVFGDQDGDGETPSKESYFKDEVSISCQVDNSVFWRTVDSRRNLALPVVFLGYEGSSLRSMVSRDVEIQSGSPLAYQAGFRDPSLGDENQLVWGDQKESDEGKVVEINGAEAILLDINLRSKREIYTLLAGVSLGVVASVLVASLSTLFDTTWDHLVRKFKDPVGDD